MKSLPGFILLVMLSVTASAQYYTLPDTIFDLMASEVIKGRLCDSLQARQQTEINALNSLISAQGTQLSNQKELISTQAQKIALSAEQLQAERELGRVRKEIAQKRIKRAKRLLVLSGAGNVVLLILLL